MGCEQSNTATPALPPKNTHHDPSIHNQSASNSIASTAKDNRYQVKQIPTEFELPAQSNSNPTRQISQRQKGYLDQNQQQHPIGQISEPESQDYLIASIANSQELIDAILQELQSDEAYNVILQVEYLCKTVQNLKKSFLSKNQKEAIILLLMQYAHRSQNLSEPEDNKNTFLNSFARQLIEIKQKMRQRNVNTLKLMNYICLTSPKEQLPHSFLDLKFDLSQIELKRVLSSVKKLQIYDRRGAYFLIIYLQISAFRLQNSLITVIQIERKLAQCFEFIVSEPFAFGSKAEKSQNDKHSTFKKTDYHKQYIDFKNIPAESRLEYIETHIRECSSKCSIQYTNFRNLIHHSLQKWRYPFEVYTSNDCDKIKIELNRKIVDVQMQKLSIENTSKDIEQLTLQDLYFLEIETYKEQIKEILAFIDGQVRFEPSNLLYANCYFHHFDEIDSYVDHLNSILQVHHAQIIGLNNKLKTQSSIILKISINDVFAQINLILLTNYNAHSFNSCIQELTSNRTFSCFSRLKMLSNSILPIHFAEIKELIRKQMENNDKANQINLSAIQQNFKEFEQLLPFKLSPISDIEINSAIFQECREWLKESKKNQKNQKKRMNIDSLAQFKRMISFKTIMKDITSAWQQENQFYRLFEQSQLSKMFQCAQLGQQDLQLMMSYAEHIKKKGINLLNTKFFDKAQKKFQTYIEIGKHIKSILMVIEGKRCLGLIQYKKSSFVKALQMFQRCLEMIAESSFKMTDRLKILASIGDVYNEQQKYEMALEVYEECQNILQLYQGGTDELSIIQSIAQIHSKRNQHGKAHSYFEKCLQTQQKMFGFDSFECISYLIKLSNSLNSIGSHKECLEILERCLRICQHSQHEGKTIVEITIQNLIANQHFNNMDYVQALESQLNCLNLIEQNEGKSSIQYSQTLKEIGEIYEQLGNFQQSLNIYEQSLSIKQKLNLKDEVSQLQVLSKIAKVHEKLNHTSKSMQLQQKIANIQEKSKDLHNKDHLDTFLSIAKKSLDKGNYPQSLKYFKKSLNIVQQLKGKDSFESIQLLKGIGTAYKLQGHYEQSIRYFSDSLTILEKQKGKTCIEATESYHDLANIYEITDNYQLAETYYRAALQLCEKFNVKYYVYANSNLGLGNIYFHQQLYSKAFQSYEKSLPFLEKVNPKQYQLAIQQMDACDKQIQMQFGVEKQVQNQD